MSFCSLFQKCYRTLRLQLLAALNNRIPWTQIPCFPAPHTTSNRSAQRDSCDCNTSCFLFRKDVFFFPDGWCGCVNKATATQSCLHRDYQMDRLCWVDFIFPFSLFRLLSHVCIHTGLRIPWLLVLPCRQQKLLFSCSWLWKSRLYIEGITLQLTRFTVKQVCVYISGKMKLK